MKREYCSERDLLEITNEFQNLKKEEMSVSKYTTTFLEKMELVPYLNLDGISKVEKFANGLPKDFGSMVKLATTLEVAIQVAKSLEDVVKGITTDKEEVGGKRNNDESSKSNKKNMSTEPSPNGKKPVEDNKAKWCENVDKRIMENAKNRWHALVVDGLVTTLETIPNAYVTCAGKQGISGITAQERKKLHKHFG